MRSVLVAVCFVIAIYLGIQGAEGDDIHFSVTSATSESYSDFLSTLRTNLARGGTQSTNGIPILNMNVRQSERFVLVVLTNYNNESITVAIDVVNVYVVGYRVGQRFYFLIHNSSVPVDTLFPSSTTRVQLPYTSSYVDLERRSQTRESMPLGLLPLSSAISNLFHNNVRSIRTSLLVIIQMVSEAARFRSIERSITRGINSNHDYTPNPVALSLENNWGALSEQIQWANPQNGGFSHTITLQSRSYDQIFVRNIANKIVTFVALLAYKQCGDRSTGGSNTFVAQPVDVLVEDNSPDTCPVQNSPTRISGRDGLCVDVRGGYYNDGDAIQLWPCGQKGSTTQRQQWTFHKDGTIRSMGKCMTTASGAKPGNYVFIYDCTSPADPQFKWVLSDDGSITNSQSGLALTAPKAGKGTTLTVETNIHAARQGWTAGDDVDPLVSLIMGYADLCIQVDNAKTKVTMGPCVFSKQQQQWALYNDGTIRINSDRNLCLTSGGHSFSATMYIDRCQGVGNQRWVFKTNGYILNPNAKLVMQVKRNDVSNSEIILGQPTDLPTQKWVLML